VNDIKVVLRLAKVRAEQGSYSNDEYAANHASIEAVETWLREVGALPPERSTEHGRSITTGVDAYINRGQATVRRRRTA
jgi:hypothetical protein